MNSDRGWCKLRFGSTWAIEPNLVEPLEVSRHANAMASIDPLLPLRPPITLMPQLQKNHLITSVLRQKDGQCKFDGGEKYFTSEMGNVAHKKALFEGVWCDVWEYFVYEKHKVLFLYMMAMCNLDVKEGRGED